MKMTVELAEIIIRTMLEERRSLNSILKETKVGAKAFYDFLDKYPMYSQKYARAQQARAELLVEEIIDIADTETDAQVARNRIDARKWYASKMQPHKFGDRIDLNVNQTIDISAALLEAKQRVSLPTQYQTHIKDVENVEIIEDFKQIATGSEPVTVPDVDIFS